MFKDSQQNSMLEKMKKRRYNRSWRRIFLQNNGAPHRDPRRNKRRSRRKEEEDLKNVDDKSNQSSSIIDQSLEGEFWKPQLTI